MRRSLAPYCRLAVALLHPCCGEVVKNARSGRVVRGPAVPCRRVRLQHTAIRRGRNTDAIRRLRGVCGSPHTKPLPAGGALLRPFELLLRFIAVYPAGGAAPAVAAMQRRRAAIAARPFADVLIADFAA